MREELQLFGYVIFRPFADNREAPPVVLVEMGWDSPEEVLEFVNAHAMVAGHGEMFVVSDADPCYFENGKADAVLIIGHLDQMLKGVLGCLHNYGYVLWGNAMIHELRGAFGSHNPSMN